MNKVMTLGEIAVFKTGPFGTQLSASEYVTDGTPVINVRNIGYGEIITSDLEFISHTTAERLHEHVLQDGDIVFGRKGSVDRHAYIDDRYTGWIQGSDCIRVRMNGEINSRFISHYLKLDRVKKQINSSSVGSTMASLNTDILSRIQIVLPSLKQQNNIEAVLSVFENKIDLNTRICAKLESMAKTLYDYWFTQFDFPNAEGKPYRSSGGKMVWNEQLKREIPHGWEVGTIDSILAIDNNSVDPSKLGDTIMEHYSIPAFDDGKYPVYEPANTIESGKYAVNRECILTSKLNPHFKRLWDPYCDTDNAICSTEFIVYRPRDLWTRSYCYAVLNSDSFYAHMVSNATASTGSRKRIQPDVSASFQLAMPDEQTMRAFVKVYDPILKQLKNLRKENHELASLRDWLLPMLMNGQATVE